MDKLDFAYFCKGMSDWMKLNRIPKGFQGELDFVGCCIRHFDLIEELVPPEDGYSLCFLYEVAEPFGYITAGKVANSSGNPVGLSEVLSTLARGAEG